MAMRTILPVLFGGLLLGGLLSACDSNPVDDDREAAHFEPVRAELVLNGAVIAEVRADNLDDDELLRDTIEVSVGYETALIRTRFYDEEGDALDPAGEEAYTLSLDIDDPELAAVEQHDGEAWSFHVVGESVGETLLLFATRHEAAAGQPHVDFGTFRIPVHVVQSGGRHDGGEHDGAE